MVIIAVFLGLSLCEATAAAAPSCVVPQIPRATPVSVRPGEEVATGDDVSYICSRGWLLNKDSNDSAKITCARGIWKGSVNCSRPVSCAVETLPNGSANRHFGTVIMYGARVMYSCNPSLRFDDGRSRIVRTCLRHNFLSPSLDVKCVADAANITLIRERAMMLTTPKPNNARLSVPIVAGIGGLLAALFMLSVFIAFQKKSKVQEYRRNAPRSPSTPSSSATPSATSTNPSTSLLQNKHRATNDSAADELAFEIMYRRAEIVQRKHLPTIVLHETHSDEMMTSVASATKRADDDYLSGDTRKSHISV